MKINNVALEKVCKDFKIGKKLLNELMYCIVNSEDYWTCTDRVRDILQKSEQSQRKKIVYAFKNYARETNQFDLTSQIA